MAKGWFRHSRKHADARRGIKSAQRCPVSPVVSRVAKKQRMLNDLRKFTKTGVYDERWSGITAKVYKVNNTIIKKAQVGSVSILDTECELQNILKKKFTYYPICILIDKTLLTEFKGETSNVPIGKMDFKHQRQIAEAVQHLYNEGYLLGDIRNENVSIDDKDNAVIIDFGNYFKTSGRNLNSAYDTTILSIFENDFRKAEPYLIEKEKVKEMLRPKHIGVFTNN